MEKPSKRKKIAILGGGTASLTTAFELTNQQDWKEKFEITIYQLGWRLGGKGASGRGDHGRIEEHGLHIWMGFYDNSFRMIRQAYEELVTEGLRDRNAPMGTWDAAFKKHSFIVIEEEIEDHWEDWVFDCPTNNLVPGDGTPLKLVDYLFMLLEWILKQFNFWSEEQLLAENAVRDTDKQTYGEWLQERAQARHPTTGHKQAIDWLWLWETLKQMIRFRDYWKTNTDILKKDSTLRRAFILLDLGVSILNGLKFMIHEYMVLNGIDKWSKLTSEILEKLDYDSLDKDDFRKWLKDHGASELTYNSGVVRSFYDLVFGYQNGEIERPSFAAGVALRSMLRIAFDYKGAVFWKMQAGMGDIVFTPLYQVLKARGVEFKFFHRVENLGLSQDKSSIATIDISRQVTLKDNEYDPLVDVKGLPCWPSTPRYDQIVEGKELQEQNINLESLWTPWKDVESITLEAGKDFDEVVLGISLGSMPYICQELITANERWKTMVDKVETVRTMAMQLWLNADLKALGWTHKSPVMCGYVDPLNTWADMDQLIDREDWPGDLHLKNIAYFCGPMQGGIPPEEDRDAPATAHKEVKQASLDFLKHSTGHLWPDAASDGSQLNWDLLVDPSASTGENRFDSQYWCANIDPSERYVLSVAGTTQYRMKTDESGFSNLYLVGDWIDNEFNAGCIEATVMSGMQASNAISGYPPLESIAGQFHP